VSDAYVDGFRRFVRVSFSWLPVVAPGLLALGICGYQSSLPNVLFGMHGADDGVYLGAALRLAHGAVPYRDYSFVQPPGLPLLMTPLALLSDRDAMAVARVVTALVAALNASLAAYAVRAFGRVAMLAAGLALAVFPWAVYANHTLTLEPYLVLFCLLGTVTMFSRLELASPRRVLVAGALFGVAAAVKAWAVLPVVAALCICLPLWRSALRPLVVGLLLGFGVVSVPFFLLAPRSFVHDVLVAQLHRGTTGQGVVAIDQRLVLILGLGHPAVLSTRANLAVEVGVGLVALVVAVYGIPARKCSRFEWFLVAATAAGVADMLFFVNEFYKYYSYFTAAFGVMLLGVCLGRLADGVRWAGRRIGGSAERVSALAASVVFPALVVAAGALVVPSDTNFARLFFSHVYDPQATIASRIPTGACVVSDEAGNLIDSNRFLSSRPGCPYLVDAFALWLTDNNGVPPPAHPQSEAFVAKWRSWLERSDYAVLGTPQSDYVPWTPDLTAWFNSNYRLVAAQPSVYVYQHVSGS
jgi:hypothetical protein